MFLRSTTGGNSGKAGAGGAAMKKWRSVTGSLAKDSYVCIMYHVLNIHKISFGILNGFYALIQFKGFSSADEIFSKNHINLTKML